MATKSVNTAEVKKEGKLQILLSKTKGSDLLGERGERLFRSLKNSHNTFIANLENKLFQMQDQREEMLDLGRTNSTSLSFKSVEDNEKFIEKWHKLDVEIALLEEEIKVAKQRDLDWF